MALQIVNIGTAYRDPVADKERDGFKKINENFAELFSYIRNYEIGAWDMLNTASVTVDIGAQTVPSACLPSIVGVTVMNDALPTVQKYYPLNFVDIEHSGTAVCGSFYMSDRDTVVLHRQSGMIFESNNFDASTGNRGYITILWAYAGE